ncbi:MAG TPA: GNAT family N-acetyltransferase [Thermoplasmata archaeon]|jgi:ribosomal protein S18 acetylase RimI-like enzyme|nr:GNAT family N-acetyltransferase [Thermoplasmata archaeon]
MNWRVRRATPGDEAALADLCAAAVGPDDYVIAHLAWELKVNTVHVALDAGERIVGMTVYRRCLDGSGWLAMARTHPAFRRQGVNRALVGSFARMARVNGVRYLRLWTNARNEDGIATFRAIGFHEVARFDRIEALAEGGAVEGLPCPARTELWEQVERSSIVAKGNGHVPYGRCFVPASPSLMSQLVARGELRYWRGNLIALPEPPGRAERDVQDVTLWAGDPPQLLKEARRQAAAAGRPRAGVSIPHDPELLGAAAEAGFELVPWGIEAVLCELSVS